MLAIPFAAPRPPVSLLLASTLLVSLLNASAYAAEPTPPAASAYADAAQAADAAAAEANTALQAARAAEVAARQAAHVAARAAAHAAAQAAAEAAVANRVAAAAATKSEALRGKLQLGDLQARATQVAQASKPVEAAPAAETTSNGPTADIGITQDDVWGTGGSVKIGAGNATVAAAIDSEFTQDAQATHAAAAWQFQENRVLVGSVGYATANASKALQGEFGDAELSASNVRVGLQTGDSAVTYEQGQGDDADLSSSKRYVGKEWQEVSAKQRLAVGEQAEVLVNAGVRAEEQSGQKDVRTTGGVEGNYYLADQQGKLSAGVQNWQEGGNYDAKVRYEHKLGDNNTHWFTEAKATHGNRDDVQVTTGLALGESQQQRYARPAKGTTNALDALAVQKNTLHYSQFDGGLGELETKPDKAAPRLLSTPSLEIIAGDSTTTTLSFDEASTVSISAPTGISATLAAGSAAATTHQLSLRVADTVPVGNYTVNVTATDSNGNSSSTSIPVSVTATVVVPPPSPVVPPTVADADGDTVPDSTDNCPAKANVDQADLDGDKVGDTCDTQDNRDTDTDKVQNYLDKCPNTPAGASITATGCQVISLNNNRDISMSVWAGGASVFFYTAPDLTKIEQASERITVTSSKGTPKITISSNAVVVMVSGTDIDEGSRPTIRLSIDGVVAATAQ